jgi:16S rRNA (guanine(527)-N(7))-methyltransferase RsmG
LRCFIALLLRWNQTVRLIACGDEVDLWSRHVADSLQLLRFLPEAPSPVIDLGSGAGFPGLVLAIASPRPVHLVESEARKVAFLREAARQTEATVTLHAKRIETTMIAPAPTVTARALAPLPRLLPMITRFLAPGGAALVMKGVRADKELSGVADTWQMTLVREPSLTDPDSVILRISDLRPKR